jgi:hypothetical protein
MTDVAYLCHNCGSVHEVESIRHNLILDLRTAASYELSERRLPDPRALPALAHDLGLAQALWPEYSHHPYLARGRRLVQGLPAPISDCPVPCRAAAGGSDAPEHRARRPPSRLARLVLALLGIREPLRLATRVHPGTALRHQ